MAGFLRWTVCALLLLVTGPSSHVAAQTGQEAPLTVQKAIVGNGVELHYVDRGAGVPVVFVHGSLSDGGYWTDQVNAFAQAGFRRSEERRVGKECRSRWSPYH